jgi:hypothetical protein
MPKRISRPKRPSDVNQLAHQLVRESTEERYVEPPKPSRDEISRFMAVMGRKGGKKSAKSRMVNMTPEQRSEIAANAARAMWAKKKATKRP